MKRFGQNLPARRITQRRDRYVVCAWAEAVGMRQIKELIQTRSGGDAGGGTRRELHRAARLCNFHAAVAQTDEFELR